MDYESLETLYSSATKALNSQLEINSQLQVQNERQASEIVRLRKMAVENDILKGEVRRLKDLCLRILKSQERAHGDYDLEDDLLQELLALKSRS